MCLNVDTHTLVCPQKAKEGIGFLAARGTCSLRAVPRECLDHTGSSIRANAPLTAEPLLQAPKPQFLVWTISSLCHFPFI